MAAPPQTSLSLTLADSLHIQPLLANNSNNPSAMLSQSSSGGTSTSVTVVPCTGSNQPNIGLFRPKFRYTNYVPINIPLVGDGFQLRRK
jgi:hypothetical protein